MKGLVLVLSCLLAAGLAAEVDKPVIPDPFTGSGTVSREMGGITFTGTFKISRDVSNEKGMESEVFPSPSRTTTNLALLRYDDSKTYYARGDAGNPHCFVEEGNYQGMENFWAWVDNFAKYNDTHLIGSANYTSWVANVGGVRLELSYPEKVPSAPFTFYYNRYAIESTVRYTFKNFKPSAAPGSHDFDVPKYCSF